MTETFQEITLDLGSTFTKIGIPDITPEHVFPTVVGYPPGQLQNKQASGVKKNIYVGDEALSKVGIQQLELPVNRGLIENWDYAEKILWHAQYNELRCEPAEIGLMILEHPTTPASARQKLATYLIDMGVAAFFFVNPATSAMLTVSQQTGVVLCSGGQTTYSMAVQDGKGILSSLVTLDIGREDIVGSMAKSLTESGRGNFETRGDRAMLNDVLEKHGYIALDYNQELQKKENEFNVQYETPDGQIHHFHHDLFKHYEILFQPELYGLEKGGIHSMIHATIQKCDPSIHMALYSNIVLAGGNTIIQGLEKRLTKELQVLAPKYRDYIRFKNDSADRKYRPFKGASFFSATPYCRNHLWITRYDYDEGGDNILEKQNPLGLY
jgi:actin-related protein